jgi:8-oxo-dGTP pyrophosphatase MutT (NUDIX family)
VRQATLLFLIDEEKILLALKKRGFGMGKWNGVGGKPNEGESIDQTAIRECQEEINVTPILLSKAAELSFYFPKTKPKWDQQVTVYRCDEWKGIPKETEEMAPKWFNFSDIPYQQMWADDKFWLPKVLNGDFVEAEFYFDESNAVIKQKVKIIAKGNNFNCRLIPQDFKKL